MKKFYLLSLAIPVVVGVLLVRSWLLSRPRDVFYGAGEIRSVVFSNDGKTLIVTQRNSNLEAARQLTALHFDRSFTPKWSYNDGEELGTPQFFLSDSRVLVDRGFIRTLDANTGQELQKEGNLINAAISPDGKWLACKGAYPSDMSCLMPSTISQKEISVESATEQNGSVVQVIEHEWGGNNNFFFSPDGQSFATQRPKRSGKQLELYDVKTWKRTQSWPDFKANAGSGFVQWSRNGRFLLSVHYYYSGDGPNAVVNLWRVRDGQLLSSTTVTGSTETVGKEPSIMPTRIWPPKFEVQNDGRLLSFGIDNSVSLSKSTNLSAGFESVLSLPSERITTATLSPDGAYLVAGTRSGQVVWKQVKLSTVR